MTGFWLIVVLAVVVLAAAVSVFCAVMAWRAQRPRGRRGEWRVWDGH